MRKTSAVALFAFLALAACARRPVDEAAPPSGPVLPFLSDDYPAALAAAQERDVPIFVDSWAPW